jgi:Ca2+-binding RTX toxin-like protein/subtilisin-like proprotein convertase family protein
MSEVVLHGYVSNADNTNAPPPPSNSVDAGELILDTWSELHSKVWDFASETLQDKTPRVFRAGISQFGNAPSYFLSIVTDVNSEGALKATITGIGSTYAGIEIGGGAGAFAGALIGGPVGAVVGFAVGLYVGKVVADYYDGILGDLYDDVYNFSFDSSKFTETQGMFLQKDVNGNIVSLNSIDLNEVGTQTITSVNFDPLTGRVLNTQIFESDNNNLTRFVSEVIHDNNAGAAPAGTIADPNKFYASNEFNTLTKISNATGTPITTLQSANPGVNPNTPLNTGTSVNLPPVDNSKAPIITVNANPTPQTGTPGQSDVANNTNQGYVSKSATSSVKYNNNMLNATRLAETTMAGMASGGVRPGEIQRDYNRPVNDSYNQVIFWTDTTENPVSAMQGNVLQAGLTAHSIYIDPLLLDLGSGIGTTSFKTNPVFFDMDHSGTLKNTSWANSNTGMLAIADANGKVTNISQLFSPYFGGTAGSNGGVGSAPFANGFDALASVDSNHDGKITSSDAIWSQLRVWVDSNQSGSVGTGELKTLAQLGITQINVGHTSSEAYNNGNRIAATGSFVRNGQTSQMADVDLISDPTSTTLSAMGNGTLITSSTSGTTTTGYSDNSTQGATLNANTLGVNNLFAGSGNDTLIARTTGSMLVGGAGSDTYQGGAGDDVFVVSADDDPANISGGGGTDMLVVTGDAGMTINMAHAGVTIAEGGKGDDVIMSGGRKGVYIKGGIGNSLLIGGAGDDVIMGGSGHNTIIGGTGKAIIYAGPQGDLIYGAAGSSIINAGGGKDTIVGGASDDLIKVGMGNANIDGGGGTNLVEFHGSYAEYRIVKVNNGYWIADRIPNRDGTVFVTNVQKLNFSDIQAVDLTLPNALPVADTLRINSGGNNFNHTQQSLISAAQLLANDHRLASSGALHISAVSNAIGGTVSITSAGDVLFTPDAAYNGIMSFKYTVADAQGHAAGSVVDLNTGQTAPMRAKVVLETPEIPTDPLIAKQWYLNDANILPVWMDYTGQGVRIGQFEPGGEFAVEPEILNYNHSDLAPNIDPAWLATEKADGTLPSSFSNHATMVAGIMVAANNGSGAVGVAYNAKIGGYYLTSAQDVAGLGHMASYDVANNSWVLSPDFAVSNFSQIGQLINSTEHYAADNGRGGLGTVIVGAAGNERATQGSAQGSFSNNNRFTVQVGAINQQGDLSTLSQSQAPFSNAGSSILVSAPGSNMASTSQVVVTDSGSIFGNNTGTLQGTSFATPIVSGIVALMLEANPNLGYRDVQEILAMSSHKIVDSNTTWDTNDALNWNGGGMHVSNDYGFGEVDALAAVRLAETWITQQTGTNESVYSVASNATQTVNAGGTFNSTLTMSSGLTVEHIEVDLGLTFTELDDLTVKLIAPNGTESILLKNNDPGSSLTSLGYTFMSTHSWGELSAGNWTLQVTNATNGHPVNLNGWELRLYGNQTTADDTYIYTNEFASQKALVPARGTLNDAVNGAAGGINTINASAVTGNTSINLNSTTASIGGTSLTIQNPGQFNNLFSGDGNDTLTAGSKNAILDGGRGNNTLTGGAGTDLYVVRQRASGQDTIVNFNTSNGEVIDLVGFSNLNFSNLTFTQQGTDVLMGGLGASQSILIKNTSVSALTSSKFVFQDAFVAPSAYTTTGGTGTTLPPGVSGMNLQGGWTGVQVSFQNGTSTATLKGTVYQHDSSTTDYFAIKTQSDPDTADNSYNNALQGFKHGIDKIDMSALGIGSFSDLTITKVVLYSNGSTQVIQGVKVFSNSLGPSGTPRELLYLDGLEVNQVTATDFIFAPKTGDTVSTSPPTDPNTPNNIVPNSGQIDPGLIGSNNGVTYTQDGNGVVTVHSAVNFALPETINILELTGDKDIIGTANNNGDTIISNTGQDTLIGGTGNDTYFVNNSGDQIVENLNSGTDNVQASVSYALNDNVENLTLTGTGDINGTGNTLNNIITGNSGANVLDGLAGNDTMIGGLGNDTYVVDSASDVITENANAGIDTVQSSLTYSLTNANLENLTLTGTAAINGTGNSGDNILAGNSGANSLSGGSGNDTYVFASENYGNDTIADTVGSDTLDFSAFTTDVSISLGTNMLSGDPGNSIDWTNSPNAIENLTTGFGNDTLNGNSLANLLIGNEGNDTLIGLAGNDTLNGGVGDDSYLFANGFNVDSIIDASGNDTLDFSLLTGALTYNATTGSIINGPNAVNFTPAVTTFEKVIGGSGSETFTGGSFAETFVGGAGNDTFNGGSGNDSYVYANGWGSDSITAGSGIETVDLNAVTTALNVNMAGAGNEVSDGTNVINWTGTIENLTTGSGIDTINGTSGDNVISSGAGSDAIWAALGNDTVDGGTGNDRYVYTGAWGNDSIIDGSGTDQLDFSTNTSNITFNLTAGTGNKVTDGISTINWTGDIIENVKAGTGNDSITGSSGANSLNGGAGNDTYTFVNGWGSDSIMDASGIDTVNLATVTSNLNVNLGAGAGNEVSDGTSTINWSDTIENITTGSGIDTINGTSGDNSITSGAGSDAIWAAGGNDTTDGGDGNDRYVYTGAWGSDSILDSFGTDTLDFRTDASNLTVNLTAGVGDEATDLTSTINWAGNIIENVWAGTGTNVITGNSLANSLIGNTGLNTLNGGAGNDTLQGGTGNSTYLFALGDGQDTITETGGTDTLTFNNSIIQLNVAFFQTGGNLQIGYKGSTGDVITIQGQTTASSAVEKFQLSNGNFMTNTDVNLVLQQMTSYANSHPGTDMSSISAVENNTNLMNIVNGGWHA